MNPFKKSKSFFFILISLFYFRCSPIANQSQEQNSYNSKTSIQINLISENLQQQYIKEIVIELKNKSRSFNYFGVTDSNGTVLFNNIINDN